MTQGFSIGEREKALLAKSGAGLAGFFRSRKPCPTHLTPQENQSQIANRKSQISPAFSLIELLVVIAIIGLLASLAMPSLTSILGGSKINLGVESVSGALSSARQLAVTKNRDVEFRLIEMTDPTFPGTSNAIRAVQILEIRETGTNPIGKPRVFPSGVIIGSSSAMSSLGTLSNIPASGSDTPIPGVSTSYSYRSFRFRPDGSINLKSKAELSGTTNYFLTIYDEKFQSKISGNNPPPNFATIQLEPSTGAATLFRP